MHACSARIGGATGACMHGTSPRVHRQKGKGKTKKKGRLGHMLCEVRAAPSHVAWECAAGAATKAHVTSATSPCPGLARRTSHPSGCRERRQLPHGSIACTQLCVMAMDADLDAQHCLDSGSGGVISSTGDTTHLYRDISYTKRTAHYCMCSDERNDLLRRETCLRSYACSNVCWSYSCNWISTYC